MIRIKLRYILIFLFGHLATMQSIGQIDSTDNLTISLLTCSAGDDLYSIFGHSAIRVVNTSTRKDLVFNYGTFDFDEPGFMYKFLKGKLNYKLAIQTYTGFIRSYEYQQRSVVEQRLNFTPAQKQKVERFLYENYLPENRAYLYDFFHDNCATRIRDVFEEQSGAQFLVPESDTRDLTFRQGLDQFDQAWPWTDFGMDLILGLNADKKMDLSSEMYLPDYLSDNLFKYIINQQGQAVDLLTPPKTILSFNKMKQRTWPWPLIFFSALFLITLGSQLLVTSKKIHKAIDLILFSTLGLAGLLMAFMWWGTDHRACKDNLNLIWANPFYLFLIPLFIKNKKIKWPFILIIIFAVLLMAGFQFSPQEFHPAVLPILGIITLRCIYRLKSVRRLGA